MFTCIGLFIQSIFMCQLFFICLVYILLCRLGLFNNWVGFLITQVYFIVVGGKIKCNHRKIK